MGDGLTRKEFLRRAAGSALAFGLGRIGLGEKTVEPAEAAGAPLVVVAQNQSPAALVRAAVNGLGGMKRFVSPGGTVVIKPNAAWQRTPAQAANTNPEVLAEVVRLCKQAGARVVKVMDHAVDEPDELVFGTNGLKQAAERAGAIFISGRSPSLYRTIRLPRGKAMRSSQVLNEVMEADLFINLPIAKVHNAVPLTLGLKNLMGVTLNRDTWHNSPDLSQAIADFATVVRPHLTIMDAVRVLLSNGPKGPGQTKDTKMVIAGADPVAVDAFTAKTVFGMKPEFVRYIAYAKAAGLGEMDLSRIKVQKVS